MMLKTLALLFIISITALFANEAQVKFLIGDVRYKESIQQADWNSLRLNAALSENNIVRTGKESRCEIVLPDGSQIRVMAYSMLKLDFLPKPGNKRTDLFAALGRIFFKVKKSLANKFRIKSPASVASIRGTEFLLINSTNSSEIWVKSGQVIFSNAEETKQVIVNAGYKSVVKSGGVPLKPVGLSYNEVKVFESKPAEPKSAEKSTSSAPAQTPTENTKIQNSPTPSNNPQPERPPTASTQEEGWGWGLSVGAVTIDNELYNQIGLRPTFSIGKFGMALDLTLYIDSDGNIRGDNWDSFSDIIEKIYYVRWGVKGDPFYTRIGALTNNRLGYGLLMNRYYNTIEYPTVIRTGLQLGFQGEQYGIDLMLNDFKEIGVPGGLYAARANFRPVGDFEIGASVVYDRNQYASLKDKDDDGVPDGLDDFPDNSEYSVDTDGDGVPDFMDPDRDGNGYTDNSQDPGIVNNDPFFSDSLLKPTPFNIKSAPNKHVFAFGFDIGYPVINADYLNLLIYSEAAFFEGAKFESFSKGEGWGIAAPGFIAKFAFINFYGSYRYLKRKFMAEYFNTTYEIERAIIRQDTVGNLKPVTKKDVMETIDEELRGFVVGADFNIYDILVFGAEYQNMSRSEIAYKTLRADLNLNPNFVPKLTLAGAYYYQQNADKLFDLNEGTVFGYRFGYEIAAGASLVIDFRTTFRDVNGDGNISGSDERIRTTNIQTVFTF
jgi:hypothetical protein